MADALPRRPNASREGETCISLGLPLGYDDGPTLACSGCIEYIGICLCKKKKPKRSVKATCQKPFLLDSNEQTKVDTYARINKFLKRDDRGTEGNVESDAARNDSLQDQGVGDRQEQAPGCHEVSPDNAAEAVGKFLISLDDDEPSSPNASAVNDNEGGGAEEVYGIQDLANDLSQSPGGPTTPMRSPSPKKKKKRRYEICFHDEVVNDVEVKGIPNTHVLVRTQQVGILTRDQTELRALKEAVTGGKFNWKQGARWFLACGLSQIPRASFYAVEQFIPCIIAALFFQAGIVTICYEALANSMPSRATIGNIVFDGAAECLAIQRARLKKARAVMLGCDKGQRHGYDHLPKCLSYWDIENDKVGSFCLDNDPTGGTSDATASAVAHSLKTKVGVDVLTELGGQSTDSGGGGTLHSLKEGLQSHEYVSLYLYFVLPCTIHAWQRALQNGMESVFGVGGLGTRNLLQLVHSCYDLQQCFPGDELDAMWTLILEKAVGGTEGEASDHDQENPNRMSAAVLTRWWYVNTAVVHLLENWESWREMAQKCLNASTSSTKLGKIASSILSLMAEPKIRADAEFVKAVSLSFFNRHLLWLQGYDEIAKDTGYRCRNMVERYFLMMEDLDKLGGDGGWRENPAFADFLKASEKLPSCSPENGEAVLEVPAVAEEGGRRKIFYVEDCVSSADNFFRLFRNTCTKHFDSWRQENPSCMFAGDKDCASALAKWTVSGVLPEKDEVSHTSQATHGTSEINLLKYITFATEKTSQEELSATKLVEEHVDAVELLADGESLWNSKKESVRGLAFWCKVHIIPLMSCTQWVEAQVREASLVATMGRGPSQRSAMALLRSTVDMAANKAAIEERCDEILRGNQHMSSGIRGERVLISATAKRKQGTKGSDEGTSVADSRLVGQSPRGAVRTKNLLETIAVNNQELDLRPDRAEFRRTLAAIYKTKGERADDIRVRVKFEEIATKMHSQRAPNSMQLEQGVDVTALMEGKLMLYNLRSKHHKKHLVRELELRGVTNIDTNTKWFELCKLMKEKEQNKKGWFTPMSEFFKQNREDLLTKL
jgi:hypothetical protein